MFFVLHIFVFLFWHAGIHLFCIFTFHVMHTNEKQSYQILQFSTAFN